MSITSIVWVSTKPSMQTATGRSVSCAMRKAWIVVSTASWFEMQWSWIQPASRTAMLSDWSFQIDNGPPTARFAMVITSGTRKPAMLNITSLIKRMPWLAEAV